MTITTAPRGATTDKTPAAAETPQGPAAGAGTGIDPVARGYNRPVLFFTLATVIPWVFWFAAAYFSHLDDQTTAVRAATSVLGVAGLVAPVGVIVWLVRDKPELRADILRRLIWPRGVRKRYLAAAALLLLGSILAAMAVSLLFGYSADQFQLRGGFTFASTLLPAWLILTLAPIFEELAWHGYGTDALTSRMRLFTATMVFSVVWAFWHLPLSFIDGYYHSELVTSGWLHALNFPLSMIPFVILMNWLYFRTGRSITVTIVFHFTAGFVNEIFMTDPDSKLIQTALLLVVSAVVVATNRELFFARPQRQTVEAAA